MLNSFIITPEYFTLPETGKVVRESGIEDRYIRAFEKVDAHFSINKDDNSDGVIRYCNEDNKILFFYLLFLSLNRTFVQRTNSF